MKRAYLLADAVSVLCPHCQEPQPNKSDGSEQWTIEDFRKAEVKHRCVACDEWFYVAPDSKVQFYIRSGKVKANA